MRSSSFLRVSRAYPLWPTLVFPIFLQTRLSNKTRFLSLIFLPQLSLNKETGIPPCPIHRPYAVMPPGTAYFPYIPNRCSCPQNHRTFLSGEISFESCFAAEG